MKKNKIQWIGNIPNDWEIRTIRRCLVERNEKNRDLSVNTILSLSAKEGVTLYDGENHSGNKPREDLSDYKRVKIDDIVVNSMNILSGSVGLSKFTGVVSPVYYIYYTRCKNDNIKFFNYIFQCKEFQRSLRGLGNGILIKETENGNLNTIRTRIPSKKLGLEYIPYCDPLKQKKIVEYLDVKCLEIDSLIEIERNQIVILKEYKQSIITEAVTIGFDKPVYLKDSGIDWIGKIPENWQISKLKYIASHNDESIKNDFDSKKTIEYVDIGSVSLENGIEQTEMFEFKDAPSRARRITKKGDIIVSTVRTYLKAIASIDREGLIVSTGFCVIRPNKKMNRKYVEFYCKSNIFTNEVSKNSNGISYPAINSSTLMNFEITMPPICIQNEIVEKLEKIISSIDGLLNIKQNKIEELNEYKKSIIYEYVTGKRVL